MTKTHQTSKENIKTKRDNLEPFPGTRQGMNKYIQKYQRKYEKARIHMTLMGFENTFRTPSRTPKRNPLRGLSAAPPVHGSRGPEHRIPSAQRPSGDRASEDTPEPGWGPRLLPISLSCPMGTVLWTTTSSPRSIFPGYVAVGTPGFGDWAFIKCSVERVIPS